MRVPVQISNRSEMARPALAMLALGLFLCVNSAPAVKNSNATSVQSSDENNMEDIGVIPINRNGMSNEDQTSLDDEYNNQEAISYDEDENISTHIDYDENEKSIHDKISYLHVKGGLYFNYFEKLNLNNSASKKTNSSDDTDNDDIESSNLNINKGNIETVIKAMVLEHNNNTDIEDIDRSDAERSIAVIKQITDDTTISDESEKRDDKNVNVSDKKNAIDDIANFKSKKSNNANQQSYNNKHDSKKVDHEIDNIKYGIDKNDTNNKKADNVYQTDDSDGINNHLHKTVIEDQRGDIFVNLDSNDKIINVNHTNTYTTLSYWDVTESNSYVQATDYKPSSNNDNEGVASDTQKHERPYWDTNQLQYMIKSIKDSSKKEPIIPQIRETSDINHDTIYNPPLGKYYHSDNNISIQKDQYPSLGDIKLIQVDKGEEKPFYGMENNMHPFLQTNFRNHDRSYKAIEETDVTTQKIHNTQLNWEPIKQHHSDEDKKYDANKPISGNNFKRPYWESFSKNERSNDEPEKDFEQDSLSDEKDHYSKNTNNYWDHQKGGRYDKSRNYVNHNQNTRKRTDWKNKEESVEKYDDTNYKSIKHNRGNSNHNSRTDENKNYNQHRRRNWQNYGNRNWKNGDNYNLRPYTSNNYNRGSYGTNENHDVHYGKNVTDENRRQKTYRYRKGEYNKKQSDGKYNRHHDTPNNSDRYTYHNRHSNNHQGTGSGIEFNNGNNNEYNHRQGARNSNNYDNGKRGYYNPHQGDRHYNKYDNKNKEFDNHHQGADHYSKYDNNSKKDGNNYYRQGAKNYNNYDNKNKKVYYNHDQGVKNSNNHDNSKRDDYNHHQDAKSANNYKNDKRDIYSHQNGRDNYRYHHDGKSGHYRNNRNTDNGFLSKLKRRFYSFIKS